MERVLITGASGNVGKALLKHFKPGPHQQLLIASRKPNAGNNVEVFFDFENPEQSIPAIQQADVLFLLRPPQIADVNKFFLPLIAQCKQHGVKHIVFLSVQGADKVKFIPHAKIEKLITTSGIPYTFIRPSYFMQNLSTTFAAEIKKDDRIYLPAGKTKFLWVDVDDIGKCIASVLKNVHQHIGKAYEITGEGLYDFNEVCDMLSAALGRKISLQSPSPAAYFFHQRKKGITTAYIMVMLLLHYLPRFQRQPSVSNDVIKLTGERPTALAKFIADHAAVWR